MDISLAAFILILLLIALWYVVQTRRQAEREEDTSNQLRKNRRSTAWDSLHNFDVRPKRNTVAHETSSNYYDYQAGR